MNISQFWEQDAFSNRKPSGVQAYAYKLKKFIIYLEENEFVNIQYLHLAIPKFFAKQVSLVTTISPKVEDYLTSINTLSNPLSKRDYAIIILALRLGIRRSDIVNLKFSNIDWENDTITFTQQKTKVLVTLPLLSEVGNALMDYILNCRGYADTDLIFLRGYAPNKVLNASTAGKIPSKYLSQFNFEDCPEKGLHILRRTLATKLFENNVPASIVSASLGHIDPNSTDVYLSIDSKMMRKCALNLVKIECVREELI